VAFQGGAREIHLDILLSVWQRDYCEYAPELLRGESTTRWHFRLRFVPFVQRGVEIDSERWLVCDFGFVGLCVFGRFCEARGLRYIECGRDHEVDKDFH